MSAFRLSLGRTLVLGALLAACWLGAPLRATAETGHDDTSPPAPETLLVGVTEFSLPEDQRDILQAARRAASLLGDRYRLEFRVMDVPKLEEAARQGDVDLVLGSAGLIRRLTDEGIKLIVSSVGPGAIDANQNEGSAFLVRRDRTDLQTLDDLALTHMVANRPSGFSGYLIAMGEIALAGYDPDLFFTERSFVGEQNASREIARMVCYGFADVGILRLCAWEGLLAQDPTLDETLRILSPVESRSACVHSTRLYPAHTLGALPHVSPDAVTAVTLAFLQMPATETGHRWAVATDFLSVDRLYRALRTGPYAYLREPLWKRFIAAYYPFLLLFCGFGFLFMLQYWNTKRLLAQRTIEVRELVKREAEQEKRLLFLERNTLVSQLSSMIAHELHQPLAAIRLLARGLVKLIGKSETKDTEASEVAEAIATEASRAKDIVERVRAYARNRRAETRLAPISEALEGALSHFQSGSQRPVTLTVEGDTHVAVMMSVLEMELVFVNLLKNARDAVPPDRTPEIRITVYTSERDLFVDVSDNGPLADDATAERLARPVSSEKPEGLGLGLGIAHNILDRHAARLTFHANRPDPGLTASVAIPLPIKKEKSV